MITVVPPLLAVAFVTIAERKTMASMQRRLGPNIVGYYGLLQAFADALKLLLKEYVSPTQANLFLFFLGPIVTLIFSLLAYAVVPYGPGLTVLDLDLGILYVLAVSSIATYGILLAGWSANSKYAFLGSIRSTAQLVSYELILTSAILLVVLLTSSLNLTVTIELQKSIFLLFPLLPTFIIFFISSVAETNRAPFDLAEAESELVSGFMTEHAAVIFVFFFLAEYASILFMCMLITMLYVGGYTLNQSSTDFLSQFNFSELFNFAELLTFNLINALASGAVSYIYSILNFYLMDITVQIIPMDSLLLSLESRYNTSYFIPTDNLSFPFMLGLKTAIFVFIFIWVRASFPRIRFDQLMSFCWTVMLPLVFAFIVLVPSITYLNCMFPVNSLFF